MGTNLIGKSRAIKKVQSLCLKAAKSGCPVLVLGPSGSGKELVAGLVGESNGRGLERFYIVNCAAIPENLIESTLFGNVKGAFTGATEERIGVFEQANGGTLFLDEVADLSLAAQAKLLRVLQIGEVTKVGSVKTIRVDVRIIAGTNKDMQAEIAAGRFRADLYFRLACLVINVPPLHDRSEDIPHIAKYHLMRINPQHRLTQSALIKMRSYSWPGNVRELINVLSQASVSLPDHRKTIQGKDVPITENIEVQKELVRIHEGKAERIVRLLDDREKISNSDVQEELSISSTAAGKWLKRLEGKNLQRHSNGKGTYYTCLKDTSAKPESGENLLSNDISVRQASFINGLKKKDVADFTRTDYEAEVSVSSRTANRDLGELVESGYLSISGKGKNARYSLRNSVNGAILPCGANRIGCGANDMARM